MGTDIKLKDLFGQTQTEQDISTVSVPKADGTGREFYVKRPVIYYRLVASPPYAPQEGDNTIIFWNLGDGGFGTEPDIGNCMGGYHEAVEGKTTKPIISITVRKYMEGIEADNSGKAMVLYLYEALAGATLLEVAGIAGTADFTAQPGWGQLIQGADGQTYTYTQLTDLGGIAIGIEQPNNILNQRLFYSFLMEKTNSDVAYTAAKNGAHTIVPPVESSGISAVNLTVDVPEPNLQEKSVEIAENGTQEFSPDTGYDGIKKLTATVNVAGGGGTSVQPDYAQNNSTAADYIKNRPGGYMVEHPAISKTMTAADYVSDPGNGYIYKFSDDPLSSDAILGGAGKVKVIAGGVETESEITAIVFMQAINGWEQYAVVSDSVRACYILNGATHLSELTAGCYFKANTNDDTGAITAYISEFTTAAWSTTVEIPEKFTEVKPANWGSSYGKNGYIPGRPAGYMFSMDDLMKLRTGLYNYTWDGVINGRDTITLSYSGTEVTYVKITDDIQTIFAYVGGNITAIIEGTPKGVIITRDSINIGSGGAFGIYTLSDSGARSVYPGVIFSYGNPSVDFNANGANIPQGVWFSYQENSSGEMTGYVNKITTGVGIGSTFKPLWPYEFIEQNPNALTTDAQTLTDDQKLQARTNIGTVAGTDKEMILSSSTAGSTKKFKITVTDDGTLTATEVTQ